MPPPHFSSLISLDVPMSMYPVLQIEPHFVLKYLEEPATSSMKPSLSSSQGIMFCFSLKFPLLRDR